MSDDEPSESPALSRVTELLRDFPNAPTPSELDRGLSKVRTRLSAHREPPSAARKWASLGAVAVLCLILAAIATSWRSLRSPVAQKPIALSRMQGGQLLQGGYLAESGTLGMQLFFDEGSQLALTPGARGRLRLDGTAGARLLLERGSVSLQITPTPEPHWSVESGPFLVTVKGTDFTVGWDPTSELFELTLRRGRVVVSGPVVGDDFVVHPGQKLRVSLPKAETVIVEERTASVAPPTVSSAGPGASAATPAPTDDSKVSANGGNGSPPAAASSSRQRQWRGALASGEWDRIISEAEAGGIETTLEAATSEDLFALADAARYRRRLDIARAALLAQRRRFPSSPRAAEAIFLLGRVSELRPGGRAQALQYYDEYLDRAPGGTYAAEALGRKMTLVNESGSGARSIAEEYLRRFPHGSYAGAARTLLSVEE